MPSIADVLEFDTAFRGTTLMDKQQYEAEVVTAAELMKAPPYFFPDEKQPTRLFQATKLMIAGKVRVVEDTENVWEVANSRGEWYTVTADGCNCPQVTKTQKSKWCKHAVAAKLWKNVQLRVSPMAHQPALALPPTTVDERLAAPLPKDDARRHDRLMTPLHHGHECPTCECSWDCVQADRDVMVLECPACVAQAAASTVINVTATDQEAPMSTPSADEYIPEPPEKTPAAVIPVASASLVPATTLAASALEASLAEWSKQRSVITRYIQQHFVDGTDYYTIKVGGRETKPTLGKPGAEKFLSLFQMQAAFRKDSDTWEMLGCPTGVLCYVCQLTTRSGEIVGEGRGVRDIKKDGGDINKAVKMAQKSAQIDAILRTGALSDAFTQDLEDDKHEERPRQEKPLSGTSAREQIVQLLKKLGFTGTTREAYEQAVKDDTGLLLHPDNYPAIIEKLTAKLTHQAA